MASESKKLSAGQGIAFSGVESLVSLNQTFAHAVTEASKAYLEGIVTLQEELLGFANARLRDNEESRDALLSCRDFEEALKIQQAWARKVSERYICEAQKLVELASETSSNSWSPILAQAKDNFAAMKAPKEKAKGTTSKPKARTTHPKPHSASKRAVATSKAASTPEADPAPKPPESPATTPTAASNKAAGTSNGASTDRLAS